MHKICFVVTDAISFNVLCRGQLEYFKAHDIGDITLVCGGDDEQIDILKKRGVGRVVNIPFERKPKLFKDFICLVRVFFFFLVNRFDLVVYSTPKALLIGSLASFMAGCRNRLALVRGRVYENYAGSKYRIFRWMDRISIGLSTNVVFISRSLKTAYQEEGIDKRRLGVVLGCGSSNGVDKHSFFPLDESAYKSQDPFHVIVVGRVCLDKGIQEVGAVIERINSLPEAAYIKFTLVGKVEDSQADEIVQRLTKFDNFHRVNFSEKVGDIFRSSSLHLFLTHREGFGNVALEAAACGVPTFAFDVVGVRDSVSDESGKLFAFCDVDSIVSEIIEAIHDREKFLRRYSGASKWAIDNFESQLVWRNYKNYYQKIMLPEL